MVDDGREQGQIVEIEHASTEVDAESTPARLVVCRHGPYWCCMSESQSSEHRPDSPPRDVSVIGLGAMGSAIARALLAAGHRVTVWNRSAVRAAPLVELGAARADTVTEALARSELALVCVLDDAAVRATFAGVEVGRGTAVVNLTSSSPEQARATAARFTTAGGRYLDGAIMVPTPLVGDPDALLLFGGPRSIFDEHRATLAALGGDLVHLGDDPGSAAIHDLGLLDLYFAGLLGFVHAAALLAHEGVTARAFLPIAARMVGVLGASLADVARDLDAGQHPGDADNLAMELVAMGHVVEASEARGLRAGPAGLVHDLVAEAVAAGQGGDGFTRVVEFLRARPSGARVPVPDA